MNKLIFISFFLLFWYQPVHAQVNLIETNNVITITMNPQLPAPGDEVIATLDNFANQGAGSEIIWYIDGNEMPNLKNAQSIRFIAGEALKTQTVSAALKQSSGQTQQISKTIVPRLLDIIVEPLTYVPKQYWGRPLPTYGSQVRVSSVLHGQSTFENPNNFNYVWKLNNKPLGTARTGGYQALYTVPHGRTHTVSLEVSKLDGTLIAKRSVLITTGEVDVQLFEKGALYGLATKTLTNPFRMIGTSATIEAVPYFIDTRALGRALFTQWKINGRVVDSTNDFEITINRTGTGQSDLEFEVRNLDELLQGGKVNTTITF